jgi:hypothetical protein
LSAGRSFLAACLKTSSIGILILEEQPGRIAKYVHPVNSTFFGII